MNLEGSPSSKTSSKNADSDTGSKKKKRAGTKFGAKKGKQFEREIATALGHIFPDAQRMLEYQGSNVIGVDLENTDIFRFQCKCTANYKNPNAIFEIREKGPHVPVLVTKANNRPPMAVLPFEEFVTLLERAYGHRERLINPYAQEKVYGIPARVEPALPAPKFVTASEIEAEWEKRSGFSKIMEDVPYIEVESKLVDDLLSLPRLDMVAEHLRAMDEEASAAQRRIEATLLSSFI